MFNKFQKGSVGIVIIFSICILNVIFGLIVYDSVIYKKTQQKNEFSYITDVLKKSKILNCKNSSFVDGQIDLYTDIKYTNYLKNMNRFLLCSEGLISLKYSNNDILKDLSNSEDENIILLSLFKKRIEKKDKSFKAHYLDNNENEIDEITCFSDTNKCSVVFIIK